MTLKKFLRNPLQQYWFVAGTLLTGSIVCFICNNFTVGILLLSIFLVLITAPLPPLSIIMSGFAGFMCYQGLKTIDSLMYTITTQLKDTELAIILIVMILFVLFAVLQSIILKYVFDDECYNYFPKRNLELGQKN